MSKGPVFEPRFVCHRAANAIVTQVDPLRVSTDALQIINQFLDEFLTLLLSSAQSLDLSRIKSVVLTLLPSSSLGKNAIVEAELQVKSLSETADTIDYEAYERTRSLLSLDAHIVDQLKQGCVDYCTLAEKNHQINNPTRQPAFSGRISPIVIVYITSILEHLAEYVLTAVAMTAEIHDTEYIRLKEVYQALMDDSQVSSLFNRMDLKTRLEKRSSQQQPLHYTQHQHQHQHQQQKMGARQSIVLPMSPRSLFKKQQGLESARIDPYFDATDAVDDSDMPDNDFHHHDHQPPLQRPISIITTSTSTNTISSTASSSSSNGHKKGFRLFKKRDSSSSNSINVNRQSGGPVVSVYNPDSPSALNFEDLIRSGDTVRVSLTPNRLKSIEINGPTDKSIISVQSEPHILSFENPRQAPKPPQHHYSQHRTVPPPQPQKQQSLPPLPSLSSPPPPPPLSPQHPARRQQVRVQPIERPSSMAVKRASMIGTHPRPVSFHENVLISGNVTAAAATTNHHTISTGGAISGLVKDKVLKFETPPPAAAHPFITPPRTIVTRDTGVQTEPPVEETVAISSSSSSSRSSIDNSSAGECGVVVGDEEWFVAEDDWEDEQTVVEWLLGD